jgi:hypothetical protein
VECVNNDGDAPRVGDASEDAVAILSARRSYASEKMRREDMPSIVARSSVSYFLENAEADPEGAELYKSLDRWRLEQADFNSAATFTFAEAAEKVRRVVECARRTVEEYDAIYDDVESLVDLTLQCYDDDEDSEGADDDDSAATTERPDVAFVQRCIADRLAALRELDLSNPADHKRIEDIETWCKKNSESMADQLHDWAATQDSDAEKAWALLALADFQEAQDSAAAAAAASSRRSEF